MEALYDVGTRRYLEAVGVAEGWRCAEVGAGAGSITQWLSDRVGTSGAVLAIDLDIRFVEPLAERGNVEVRIQDITAEPLEESAYDLVHARAVLEHIPSRDEVVPRLVAALRPGGALVLEDVVIRHPPFHPPSALWDRVGEAFTRAFELTGADALYGLRLPAAMEAAGVQDVESEARSRVAFSGTPSVDFMALSLEQLGDRFVAAGLLTADEVAQARDEIRTPGRVVLAPMMVAAWGRRPA